MSKLKFTRERFRNVLDLSALGLAIFAGITGDTSSAIGLVATYMFFQVLDYTKAEW